MNNKHIMIIIYGRRYCRKMGGDMGGKWAEIYNIYNYVNF